MSVITPWWFQKEAIDSIFDYFKVKDGNPLVALPTGTGKSVVIAFFVKYAMQAWPRTRILCLTHVKELIRQNFDEFQGAWPEAPVGIYSAALKQRDTAMPIIFAGVASVKSCIEAFGWRDLVLIDEAHLLSPNEKSMYQMIIAALKAINPALKVIGFTATPYRMGQGRITDDGLFTDICYDMTNMASFNRLVAEGFICPPTTKKTNVEIDTSAISVVSGEFAAKQLEDAVSHVTIKACQELCYRAADRISWIVFAPGIENSIAIAALLNSYGVPTAAVHSKLKAHERDERIQDFKDFKLRCLVSNNILTTGFNHRPVDCIAMMRPTLSTGMWVQMVGRGTRISHETGKTDCIAEGQRVLTDHGLVPIECVTLAMRVWDGVSFVYHKGAILRGESEVITYAGLTATPDHRVYTKKGWQTFGQCAAEQTSIMATGVGWKTIRAVEGNFRNGVSQRQEWPSTFARRLSDLWCRLVEGLHQLAYGHCGLSFMRASAPSAEMACRTCNCGEATLHEPKRPEVCRLWRQGRQVPLYRPDGDGCVGTGEPGASQGVGARSHQQQRQLRCREHAVCNEKNEYGAYAKTYDRCRSTQIYADAPADTLLRRDTETLDSRRADGSRDSDTIQQAVEQTKRRVWDILDAGPRHSFTVEGLLVHNCLILDFAGNTRRLGPINDPIIPRKKGAGGGGDAPVRICEVCGTYNHASKRECECCGHSFDFSPKLAGSASTDVILRTEASDLPVIENLEVRNVLYSRHLKKGGIVPCMKVQYLTGYQSFTEFVHLEQPYGTMAAKNARDWWRERHSVEPPATVNEALTYQSALRAPKRINVIVNRKYPEVVSYEY